MDTTTHTRVVELSEAECLALATTQPVGRIAWTGPTGPSVVPVNFALGDGEVRVRTAAYSSLALQCDDSPVAFEVDAYDAATRTGWSVVMRGRARLSVLRLGEPNPDAWPVGAKPAQLVIEVAEITGRRLTT